MTSICLPRLNAAGESNCGCVRGHNEDSFCCIAMPSGHILAVVADGVGGNSGGEMASYLACHRLLWQWKKLFAANPQPDDPALTKFLYSAIQDANTDIFRANLERPGRTPMCTTIVSAIFTPELVIAAHAGDSRIYCARKGTFRQITVDHTLRNKLAEQGALTPGTEPPKNVISRALGPLDTVHPEIHTFYRAPEDRFLLCSDGLNAHWQDKEIGELLERSNSPREAVGELITGTLRRGAADNVTVVCVFPEAAVAI